jgi:hypothetical protein
VRHLLRLGLNASHLFVFMLRMVGTAGAASAYILNSVKCHIDLFTIHYFKNIPYAKSQTLRSQIRPEQSEVKNLSKAKVRYEQSEEKNAKHSSRGEANGVSALVHAIRNL